ncbi:S66 peptidase family protein [Clostridium sp. 'White wine YQ']|uniref:S66 peptidase family protein n=1 Tax=Clostridium sp. 'White wine YQ' TaxID=3027474 RepID=UPI0023667567|nr:LD-carboxypeptidase [Clostridium sp. 'White wine YQ']MDD7796382.1 LD-carboxypeptidase [Clostridium sp. 'White wine YQ']
MLIPYALKNGDTIGIVSTAFREDKSVIHSKINYFESLGFKVKVGESVYKEDGYFSGSTIARALDIMNMFKDKDVKAIICFRGGYGSINILPYINLNTIRFNKKILCGYSDTTVLINYISKKTGLITFHGPMINSDFNDIETLESLKFTLMQGNKPYSIPLGNCSFINPSEISGKLCGGNLSTICSSIGSPYEPNFKDKILILEDVNEKPYSIDRMLTQLLLSGKLHKCKGFIFGSFYKCDCDNASNNFTIKEIISRIFTPLNKPIILDFPIGHSYPNITLPIGATAKFNLFKKTLDIINPVVK